MTTVESPIIMITNQGFTSEMYWDKDVVTIGRGKKNDLPLACPKKKVSRDHVRLEKRNGEFYIYDLNSRNGTIVNGEKIPANISVKINLHDKIKVGEYEIGFFESLGDLPSQSDDPTMEHQVSKMLSVTAISRREKLAMLSMKNSNMWDTKAEKTSSSGFYMVLLSLFTLGIVIALQFKLFLEIKRPASNNHNGQVTTNQNPNNNISLMEVKIYEIPKPVEEDDYALNAVGYVKARKVTIRSQIVGKIDKIAAGVGDKVIQGQILATLSQAGIEVNLESAYTELRIAQSHHREIETQLQQAENKYIRNQKLHRQGYISDNDLEESKEEYQTLSHRAERFRNTIQTHEVEIKRLKLELEKTKIRAPFNGVITEKMADIGFVTNQEDGLFVLMDRSEIGVEVDINEAYTSKIDMRQDTQLTLIAYPDKVYKGKVRKIYPNANKLKATVKVDIAFLNIDDKILPDMGVKVTFLKKKEEKKEEPKIFIPQICVIKDEKEQWVWVEYQGVVQKRTVSLGEETGSVVEIKGGLLPGNKVITYPIKSVRENMPVRIAVESNQ